MPLSKFEANLTLRLGVKRAPFSLFTLASSCSNAYFRAYAIIDLLADRLVFLNTVTICLAFFAVVVVVVVAVVVVVMFLPTWFFSVFFQVVCRRQGRAPVPSVIPAPLCDDLNFVTDILPKVTLGL